MVQRRSPEEVKQSMIRAKKMVDHQRKRERKKDVAWAKYALLVVGVLQLLVVVYTFSKIYYPIEILLIDSAIGASFVALFFYANKKPVQAITIGLILYGTLLIVAVAIDTNNLWRGFILKLIIISLLLTGLKSAKKLPHVKPDHDDIIDQELDGI
ncbi:MAG: hypothetical protein WDZ35_02690 [Crocinitomicaceae bacterium]